jgi:hypothetical protein
MSPEIFLGEIEIPAVPAVPASVLKEGFLRMEAGETVLLRTVPAGKKWSIDLKVRITETDA